MQILKSLLPDKLSLLRAKSECVSLMNKEVITFFQSGQYRAVPENFVSRVVQLFSNTMAITITETITAWNTLHFAHKKPDKP